MGWWKLEAWKKDSKGNDVDLSDVDLEHIADCIKQGYIEGDVIDSDEEEDAVRVKEEAEAR